MIISVIYRNTDIGSYACEERAVSFITKDGDEEINGFSPFEKYFIFVNAELKKSIYLLRN